MNNFFVLLMVALAGLVSCSPPTTQVQRISIINDPTEGENMINAQSVIARCQPKSIWDGMMVRYTTITDVDYAPQHSFELAPVGEFDQFFAEEQQREQKLDTFLYNIREVCITDSIKEYKRSSIWLPLVRELEELSKDSIPATAFLVSDLLECSDVFNVYRRNKIRLSTLSCPEKVREQFRKYVPSITYTKHITLVIVHTPRNKTENTVFRTIINEIYRPILEQELGIQLNIQATL